MALIKENVLLHHRKIDVHSQEGKGTEFVTRLPDPIHGREIFQRSNFISNRIGSIRRRVAAGGSMLLHPIHGQPDGVLSNGISNLRESTRRMMAAGASRLLNPIHGGGIFQRSNVISNRIRSMLPRDARGATGS